MPAFFPRLNVIAECRAANIDFWSCPPFLFVVMGLVNIAAMVGSYLLSARFVDEPEVAALIVIAVSVIIFIIGNFIIHGFNQIAEANRIKSEFIAIVSHQLRSPLAIFKWTIDAITRARPAGSPAGDLAEAGASGGGGAVGDAAADTAGTDHLAILRENTEKMIQLVNMLLEVSRIEAGRLILRHDPVRLDILTEEQVQSFAAYARASNIAIDIAAPASLPPVRGDQERIKMIVSNLIDNAIRYSMAGGRIAISIAPHGQKFLEWKISDSGVGIPDGEQRFVFQKFFRATSGVERQAAGSGLGLYIARSLITALDGDIGFISHDHKGTTFWFRLPLYR
ncbi:MAG: HAMP domain-containing histidine kinase [Candidatus Sungbacteria bacterium]|uniref:histidine kinase n=1 Tax=Candidatus Sungiibacteriota bacterium TaxID=2750080 RepID=A0A932YVW2_9BACT|nr:HAMP domain-containing histidine kinase [Candidatus Sungbacteria bacterium]